MFHSRSLWNEYTHFEKVQATDLNLFLSKDFEILTFCPIDV
jgi:hypothetical protein